jgi:hypothetical protein
LTSLAVKLLDVSSLNYIAPMARAVLASVRPVDKMLEAFRSGEGVPYADYGDDLHEAQAAFGQNLTPRRSSWSTRIEQHELAAGARRTGA